MQDRQTKPGAEQLSAAESLEHRGNPELPLQAVCLISRPTNTRCGGIH
jgi:hypothetical protein